jgi:hypothetical protein
MIEIIEYIPHIFWWKKWFTTLNLLLNTFLYPNYTPQSRFEIMTIEIIDYFLQIFDEKPGLLRLTFY